MKNATQSSSTDPTAKQNPIPTPNPQTDVPVQITPALSGQSMSPAAVYLATLSPGSRRTMRGALDIVAGLLGSDAMTLDWSALRFQHTVAVRAILAEKYAPSYCNKILSALRGVLKAAWQMGKMDIVVYWEAVAVERVPGESLPAGRNILFEELAALMRVCEVDPGPIGVRDAAMIAVLYTCGLRLSEVVALDLEDYNQAAESLDVRCREGAGPKRGKERLVYPVDGALAALGDWLTLRGEEAGPLFHPIRKGGAIQRRRMGTRAVWKRVKRRAEEAGIKTLSPHDFRRTFIGDLLDAKVDISTVARMAGHRRVETTARYDRRGEGVKRRAAERLRLPYEGSKDRGSIEPRSF